MASILRAFTGFASRVVSGHLLGWPSKMGIFKGNLVKTGHISMKLPRVSSDILQDRSIKDATHYTRLSSFAARLGRYLGRFEVEL